MTRLRLAFAGAIALAACGTNNHAAVGLEGAPCAASDECESQSCQWPDGHTCSDGSKGACVPMETDLTCPDVVDYVCGCDGKTYPNACLATAAGESVASTGQCH